MPIEYDYDGSPLTTKLVCVFTNMVGTVYDVIVRNCDAVVVNTAKCQRNDKFGNEIAYGSK